MGFCTMEQYKRFLKKVTLYEKNFILDAGRTILLKLYFSVSKEEQARRFERRRNDPLRQWKLSEVDLQAQELWDKFSQKKMVMLGPVVERIIYDDLEPTLNRHFWTLFRDGRLPPVPPDMQGAEWKFEYVSSLAQAAKVSVMHTLTSTAEFVGMVAALDPSATKKFDAHQAIDEFSDIVGTPVRVIRSDEDVAELVRIEQEQMAEEKALMEAGAAVEGAQKLSQTPMEDGTALSELVKMTGGGA